MTTHIPERTAIESEIPTSEIFPLVTVLTAPGGAMS